MPARPPEGPAAVTERQREVASLIARGMTNPQIAETLGITLDGAKHHVSQLLVRLDLQRREEIADWYRRESSRRRLSLLSLPPLLLGGGVAAVVVTVVVVAGVIALRGDGDTAPLAIDTTTSEPTSTPDVPPHGVPTAAPDTFEITAEDLRAMNLSDDELTTGAPVVLFTADTQTTRFSEQPRRRSPTGSDRVRSVGNETVGNFRQLRLYEGEDDLRVEVTSDVTLYLSPTHALAEFFERIEASEQIITTWEVIDPPGQPASGVWDDAVRINERAGSTIVLVRVGPALGAVTAFRADQEPTTEEATALARLLAERMRNVLTALGAFED